VITLSEDAAIKTVAGANNAGRGFRCFPKGIMYDHLTALVIKGYARMEAIPREHPTGDIGHEFTLLGKGWERYEELTKPRYEAIF